MKSPSKYRITVFHPKWWKPYGDHQVSLEICDGRTRKYKPVSELEVGVRDAKRSYDNG
jgi:hypothetical protein